MNATPAPAADLKVEHNHFAPVSELLRLELRAATAEATLREISEALSGGALTAAQLPEAVGKLVDRYARVCFVGPETVRRALVPPDLQVGDRVLLMYPDDHEEEEVATAENLDELRELAITVTRAGSVVWTSRSLR
jgi:hypothetical protein